MQIKHANYAIRVLDGKRGDDQPQEAGDREESRYNDGEIA
jgi:hypothetical protein